MSTLLYNDECAVCRTIARWVRHSAARDCVLVVRPIGDDPAALRALNVKLDIWDAYATIHILMPDGSMRTGGEAVAEVFRELPNTMWFAGLFSLSLFGFRPFQAVLNIGYTILADSRPLFGCESCGTPNRFVKRFQAFLKQSRVAVGHTVHPSPHFTSLKPRIAMRSTP